jgi:hypothetical protein
MATLHIALEDGFEGKPVTVTVNGEVIFEGTPRYDLKKGFAKLLSTDVAAGNAQIAIRHDDDARELAADVGDAELFVRASVRAGSVHYLPPSTQRYGYV